MNAAPQHPADPALSRLIAVLMICLFVFPGAPELIKRAGRSISSGPAVDSVFFSEAALCSLEAHVPPHSPSAPFPAPPAGAVTVQAPISAQRAMSGDHRLVNISGDYVFKKRERLYSPIIRNVASRFQIDESLIKAVIMAESGFNPRAVSRRGARGLMQLMPRTARELGVKDIFNPEQNIVGGVKYIRDLIGRFDGSARVALAAYHAGPRKVRKYKGIPPFKTTRAYIRKIMRYKEIYQHHADALELSAALSARLDGDMFSETTLLR